MTFTDYLQTQPLLRVAAALMLGIVVGDKVGGYFSIWIWLAAVAVCLIIELLFKGKPNIQSFIILLAISFFGAAIIIKANDDVAYPFQDDALINYDAVITAEPQQKGKVLRCDLSLTSIDGKELEKPINVKAAILRDTVENNWKHIKLGSGIRAQSVMQPLANYHENSNFDYVRWLHCHGFRAQTFIFYTDWQIARVSLKPLSKLSRLKLKALKFREELVACLKIAGRNATSSYNEEDQQSAVVAAMVLGDKHALNKDTKEQYSVSGASHVLALSGLHLGIIYAILTLLFGNGYQRRWLSQALIVIAIWTYVIIVGMGTSVMRSALMLTIYSLCLVAGRGRASLNTLSLAEIILLVTNPLCLWDIGFQMSFIAVLSIVVFFTPLYNKMYKKGDITKFVWLNNIIKSLWGMAVVSITAQSGTAPLIAYYFGRFSCYFLLTNFIVVPCASIIIYGALAIFVTVPVPVLNVLIIKALNIISLFLNTAVSKLASLPGASIDNIHINTIQVFCYYIIITVICIIHSYLIKLKSLNKLDVFN